MRAVVVVLLKLLLWSAGGYLAGAVFAWLFWVTFVG